MSMLRLGFESAALANTYCTSNAYNEKGHPWTRAKGSPAETVKSNRVFPFIVVSPVGAVE